jgi:hypothetical protein
MKREKIILIGGGILIGTVGVLWSWNLAIIYGEGLPDPLWLSILNAISPFVAGHLGIILVPFVANKKLVWRILLSVLMIPVLRIYGVYTVEFIKIYLPGSLMGASLRPGWLYLTGILLVLYAYFVLWHKTNSTQ